MDLLAVAQRKEGEEQGYDAVQIKRFHVSERLLFIQRRKVEWGGWEEMWEMNWRKNFGEGERQRGHGKREIIRKWSTWSTKIPTRVKGWWLWSVPNVNVGDRDLNKIWMGTEDGTVGGGSESSIRNGDKLLEKGDGRWEWKWNNLINWEITHTWCRMCKVERG